MRPRSFPYHGLIDADAGTFARAGMVAWAIRCIGPRFPIECDTGTTPPNTMVFFSFCRECGDERVTDLLP